MSESPDSASPPTPPPKASPLSLSPPNAPRKEEPPVGFHYLVNDEIPSTPTWRTSFGPIEKVEEDKAWTSSAASPLKSEEHKRPLWANKKKERRISLQLSTIKHTSEEKDADELLPIASPLSARPSPDKLYFSGKAKSLEGIALRAFCLGISFAFSVVAITAIILFSSSPLWRVPFFFAALSLFHFLEFWTTAKYNTQEAKVDSFLLTANWPLYFIAHSAATIECLFTKLIWPNRSWAPLYTGHILLLIGLIMVFIGQFVRATAMMQLGTNFNHIVQDKKKTGHELVTSGIYGVMRHPSYFGFFYWGVGTQIVLGNPICFFAYLAVLWRFFSTRIKAEEAHMGRFFGENFIEYQKRVPTMIPFIR